jgi:hypothetical protein
MPIIPHWSLPTHGDSRSDLSLANAMSEASAADEKCGLSRYWRNARAHATHDPVDWKYHHVGNDLLSGVLPPNLGQL